jgi:toxin ParE1/3/4
MPRLVVAPEARQDLRDIRDYIAKNDPRAALGVVARLRDMARMLAAAPTIGRNRPELSADIRSFVADRYVLFYRPLRQAGGIELIRMLHGARDIDAMSSDHDD